MSAPDASWLPPAPPAPTATEPLPARPPEPSRPGPFEPERKPLYKRIGAGIAGLAVLLAKIGAKLKFLLVLLPKLKLFTTAGSMLVSVAAYSLIWGWKFAVAFVVLLLVHEMGHVIQLRREGVPASAPLFIPFMGAVVGMRSMPADAAAEARVGLAGPVLGSIGAAGALAIGEATNSNFWRAVAFVGFFLNLFNLVPVTPLDGGRAMAALSPAMWFLGLAAIAFLAFWRPNPIILIILVVGVLDVYRRWQARKGGSLETAAYYRVTPRQRAAIGLVYLGLIAALVLGMHGAHVPRTLSQV